MAHLQLRENQNMQSSEAQILKQETVCQRPLRIEAGKLQLHFKHTVAC